MHDDTRTPSNLPPNVILVGFMGSGKSSTGRALARRLGYRFVDMDAVLEEREGMSIPEVFRQKGEPYFRVKESALAAELAASGRQVVATGGGIWMNAENRSKFLEAGWCVWLRVSAGQAWERVRGNLQDRPLLAGSADPVSTIRELLQARDPFYALAPAAVETDGLTPDEVAERVIDTIKRGEAR